MERSSNFVNLKIPWPVPNKAGLITMVPSLEYSSTLLFDSVMGEYDYQKSVGAGAFNKSFDLSNLTHGRGSQVGYPPLISLD